MRWLFRAALLLLAGAVLYDVTRPPARQASARLALAGIHVYQGMRPASASGAGMCRFTPTCSRYAEVVITRDGIVRGGWLAAKRIVRCGPWTPAGTEDQP